MEFRKQRKWVESSRNGYHGLFFTFSTSSITELKKRLDKITSKKRVHVLPCGSYDELIIATDESPVFPDKSVSYEIVRKERQISAIYIAFFDLSNLSNETNLTGTLVALGQLSKGYPNSDKDIARGTKELYRAMNAIDPICTPDGIAVLRETLESQYSISSEATKAPGLTKEAKIAIGIGVTTILAVGVAYVVSSKYGAEDDEDDGIASTIGDSVSNAIDSISNSLLDSDTSPASIDRVYVESPDDGIVRKSARQLGRMVGMSDREVNLALKDLGYLTGQPGNWQLTNKGAQYAILRHEDNGYGGYAYRGWEWPMWDSSIAFELGDPIKHLEEVNRNRISVGLGPIDSL